MIYATFTFFPIAPFQEPTIFFRGKSDLRLRQRSRFWCCPPSDWCEISGMWGAAVVRNTAVCICAKFHFHFCQSAFTFIYFISTLQCLCFLWEHFSSFSWDCFQSRWILSVCSWCSCSFFSELVTLRNILAFPSAQLNFQFCNFFALLCPMLVSTIGSCSLAQFNHGVPNWDSQLNSIPCFHRHWDKDLLDEHLLDHQTFKGSPHSIE